MDQRTATRALGALLLFVPGLRAAPVAAQAAAPAGASQLLDRKRELEEADHFGVDADKIRGRHASP
ncbi:MAG TPA: hypothetical protein VMS86_13290 [Thermoanaerobaculia bacterium]|nr:hypothetical protein [Thermoanaerobaculia bacterium]